MHAAIYYSNQHDIDKLLALIASGKSGLPVNTVDKQKFSVYSMKTLHEFLDKEYRYDQQLLTSPGKHSLASMSEGEQKQSLLDYLLATKPDYLIVQNVFDNLDLIKQQAIVMRLQQLGIPIIQLVNRKRDVLDFITQRFMFDGDTISSKPWPPLDIALTFRADIPQTLHSNPIIDDLLISFRGVSISYGSRSILNTIYWDIYRGQLWQLLGPNGSGKSTLLQLINGDNPKAYGQEIFLFGRKKGSGESVWDIKKNIGCFTKSMVQNFSSQDSVESMLLSGFFDSVGLYRQATKQQRQTVAAWLDLVDMGDVAQQAFSQLNLGSQRLILVLRAMIKQPPLLLLDEPTAGLDDEESARFIALVNRLATAKTSAIIFVSHRQEEGLKANFSYELTATGNGSIGRVIKHDLQDR